MRSNWMDIAKGITIMLMVMGHSSIPHSLAVFIYMGIPHAFVFYCSWMDNELGEKDIL